MTVFVSRGDGVLTLRARAESEHGDAVGDLVVDLHPGEEAMGKTHDEWAALGPGAHEISKAPSPERAMIDAIEAGLTEGDDRLIEYVDGRPHEVLSDGRRVPLDG